MTDLFDEVEEQLRSDRYRTLARKALPWILALLAAGLVAFLAVWGWQRYREQVANKASEQYAVALEAMAKGDQAQAEKLWADVSKSPAKGYKSLALMQLGALKISADSLRRPWRCSTRPPRPRRTICWATRRASNPPLP